MKNLDEPENVYRLREVTEEKFMGEDEKAETEAKWNSFKANITIRKQMKY